MSPAGSSAAKAGTDPLLSVRNLSVRFGGAGGAAVDAVRNVSFDIAPGECVALVGESGSGKSVTALSVLRLLPQVGVSYPGEPQVVFDGQDLMQASAHEMRGFRGQAVSMIFQEPMTSLNPLHTVGQQITESLLLHGRSTAATAHARCLELLELVAIDAPEERLLAYPHQLSGGQRQRVMIAMALANEPQLLIADEPTTALDVTIQAQVLKLLTDLSERLNMALLMITHDLAIVERMANRVNVMTNGEIVEHGPTATVFQAPRHEYTQRLLSSRPGGRPNAAAPDAEMIYEAHDVRVWFPLRRGVLRRTVGHIKAVDGLSFKLTAGSTLGVVGESGSGKTTLGLSLLKLERATGGLYYRGRDLNALSKRAMRALRREMQIVFQDPFASLSPRMSVEQIVAEGLDLHMHLTGSERAERVDRVLREVGLDPDSRNRFPHEFSGGQRQRIAIARALALEPALLVLDEPTSALDMSVQAQIVDLLRDLQARRQLAYLFISHDLAVVRALSAQVIVMRHGKVVEQGPTDQVFDAPEHPYTRALMDAALHLEAGSERNGSPTP